MARLPIAVVGLGAAVEPHAKSLVDLAARVEVKAAVARTEARLAAFGSRFPFPLTTDLDRVLADSTISAVLVLTPPNTHLDLVARCASAGKHVLIEKPLEAEIGRARELVRVMRQAGLQLGVVLQHRFRPAALRLKELVADGSLGEITAASMSVPWWRPQSYYDQPGRGTRARDGGGVLITQAIHTLDLFRSLVDVRTVVAAQIATTKVHRMETEDYAAALVRLANGSPGVIQATTAAHPGGTEHIEILATKATAWLSGGNLRVSWIDGREEKIAGEGGTGGGANIMDFPHDWHRSLIADFLDAVETGRDPAITGEDALASQELIEAILARAGGG